MPQPRQRIVFCDCLDCVEQPPTTDIQSSSSTANEAAARQEPPPKCLMFVLSGVLLPKADAPDLGTATVLDNCNLPHLNRATAQGNLCLLTLRQDAAAGAPTTALPCRHSSSIVHNLLLTKCCLCALQTAAQSLSSSSVCTRYANIPACTLHSRGIISSQASAASSAAAAPG
jgi:hypothetical protein